MENSVTVYMTKATKLRLESDLDKAVAERKRWQLAIGDAAGTASDWHDNAAFDHAQAEFDVAVSRENILRDTLANPIIIEPRKETDKVDIGNIVKLQFGDRDTPEVFTLLGPNDSSTQAGWLSELTPVGKAIKGKKAGEVAEIILPDRVIKVTVLEILPGDFE